LKSGDYFGEISILSNLQVTSTVICTERAICGTLSKENFDLLMYNFPDTRLKLMKWVHDYNDDFFFMLHKCIWNVKHFKKFSINCVRTLALKMKKREFNSG
jgi:hypothetical protein